MAYMASEADPQVVKVRAMGRFGGGSRPASTAADSRKCSIADPSRPRTVYGSFDETRYRRHERTKDLAAWHEMLLDRFAGTPEDELLDRLAASPALGGPELTFLRARIAERRGDVT